MARPTQTERQSHDIRLTGHDEVVAGMDRGCAHPDEHVVIADRGPVDISGLEHLGRAVATLHDRPHPALLGRVGYADRALARVLRSLLW